MKRESINELGMKFKETKSKRDFNKLYQRVYPNLVNYIYNLCKDKDLAESLACHTMTRVWFKIDSYKDKGNSISSWIYRIAFNMTLNEMKKLDKTQVFTFYEFYLNDEENKIENFVTEELSVLNGFEYDVYKEEMDFYLNKIFKALENIDEKHRNVFLDRFLNKMKYIELANKYGTSLQNIKNWLRRTKQKIRKYLREDGDAVFVFENIYV